MATNETIYEGFWINWTDGQIRGSTLTLNRPHAAFLVAFLVLYVAFTGTHFWQLLCWITFQLRSSGDSPAREDDPLQTLLRNSQSANSAVLDFGSVAWKWRGKRLRKLQQKALWLQTLAVITMGSFLVAGIFSSRVTNTKSDVRLRPTTCGYWTKLAKPGNSFAQDLERVYQWEGQRSVNWIDSSLLTQYCFKPGQSDLSTCMAPGRQFVQWNASRKKDCPFDGITCTSQSLMLDSGLVDSSQHLGINSPPRDRIAFRKQLTCSPIDASTYTRSYTQSSISQLWPQSMSGNKSNNTLFWLEPEFGNPSFHDTYENNRFDAIFLGVSSFDTGMEASFVQNEALWLNYHSGRSRGSGEAYAVQVQQHIPEGPEALDNSKNRFISVPGLSRENSTTLLMFLMNGYSYTGGAVEDPWFKTTNYENYSHVTYNGETFPNWWAEYDKIGTLACFEDVQICNTAHETPSCASVNTYGSSLKGDLSTLLRLNAKQTALLRRIADGLNKSALGDMVVELNGGSMLARRRSYDHTARSLPAHQWTLELQQWFSTSLAATELAVKQFVTGFGDDILNQYVVPPPDEDEWMCHAQVVGSTSHASFSVLGLAIILLFGGLIMISNTSAEYAMKRLRGRDESAARLSAHWERAELLNLHNLHYPADDPPYGMKRRQASIFSLGSNDSRSSTAPLLRDSSDQGSALIQMIMDEERLQANISDSRRGTMILDVT